MVFREVNILIQGRKEREKATARCGSAVLLLFHGLFTAAFSLALGWACKIPTVFQKGDAPWYQAMNIGTS